mgnify:CR=1 FL=1
MRQKALVVALMREGVRVNRSCKSAILTIAGIAVASTAIADTRPCVHPPLHGDVSLADSAIEIGDHEGIVGISVPLSCASLPLRAITVEHVIDGSELSIAALAILKHENGYYSYVHRYDDLLELRFRVTYGPSKGDACPCLLERTVKGQENLDDSN